MCRAAVRVMVVEEALAMLEREGPMVLPDVPIPARSTKVGRLFSGMGVPQAQAETHRRRRAGAVHTATADFALGEASR